VLRPVFIESSFKRNMKREGGNGVYRDSGLSSYGRPETASVRLSVGKGKQEAREVRGTQRGGRASAAVKGRCKPTEKERAARNDEKKKGKRVPGEKLKARPEQARKKKKKKQTPRLSRSHLDRSL